MLHSISLIRLNYHQNICYLFVHQFQVHHTVVHPIQSLTQHPPEITDFSDYLSAQYSPVFLTESKGGLFVPNLNFSQSPIVYVKKGFIKWLKLSSGQIVISCSERDIYYMRTTVSTPGWYYSLISYTDCIHGCFGDGCPYSRANLDPIDKLGLSLKLRLTWLMRRDWRQGRVK